MWYRKLWTSVRSLSKDESGANAVEFALVTALVLIPLLLGIIQFGMILYTHNNMVQAAREAARVLAQPKKTTDSVTEVEHAAKAKQVALEQLDFSKMIKAEADVFSCSPGTPETCPNDENVRVTITVPLSQASLIDFLGIFVTGDLEAKVTMRKE